jgi:hypothetical protein
VVQQAVEHGADGGCVTEQFAPVFQRLAAGLGFRGWRLRCFRCDTSQMAVTALRSNFASA